MKYFNRLGQKINYNQYIKLNTNKKYKIIEQTNTKKYLFSTVWIGLDNCIFETMVFNNIKNKTAFADIYCERYKTERASKIGHTKSIYTILLKG